MTSPLPLLPRGDREWEPHQTNFNLLLGNYLLESGAIAEIILRTVGDCIAWLQLTLGAKEALVNATIHPFHVPFSYLIPYLDNYALSIVVIIPTNTMNTLGVWASSVYGAKAEYISPSSPGFDNTSIVQDTINRAEDAGGGIVLLPTYNDTANWNSAYYSGGLTVKSDSVQIFGLGKRITRCVYEPTISGAAPFLSFNNTNPSNTTQYMGAARRFTIQGFNPDLLPDGGVNRHAKQAIETVCTSEFVMDEILVIDWATGTNRYGAEGPSDSWQSKGKELALVQKCTFVSQRLVHFMANPKEPGTQIDVDNFNLENFYGSMPISGTGSDNYAFLFDAGLNVPAFKLSGECVIAGGKGVFHLDDASASPTFDIGSFEVQQIRHEQATNAAGWTVYLKKTGGALAYGVKLSDVSCSNETGGIYLNGTMEARILEGSFHRHTSQGSSPLALDLSDGTNINTKIDGFFIPKITGGTDLFSFGSHTVTNVSGETPAIGRGQLPSITMITN